MSDKEQRLARRCAELGVDGLWLRRRANVAWIADGADVHCDVSSELGVASVFWTPQHRRVLCDSIEAPRMRAEVFGSDWEIVERPWTEAPKLPEGRFASDWPEDVLADERAPLSVVELERARALGRDSAEVLHKLMLGLQPGRSEQDAAAELGFELRRRAIHAPVILCAADDRIARFRHPIPTATLLRTSMMLVLCAQRHGLIVALTRIVHFGALPADLRRRHAAACAVDRTLHAATRPGARWCDLFALAQRTYAEQGFEGEWKLHHQGGPLDYNPRNFVATPTETRVVKEHQLVAWNPSVTGSKSEDTITSAGEVLTAMEGWPELDGRPTILERRA